MSTDASQIADLDRIARDRFGMRLVPVEKGAAQALALSGYPVKPEEPIQWGKPLYDTDGFEHSLVALGSLEVVTKQHFTYAVWDRKTGRCLREGCSELAISNAIPDEAARAERREAASQVLAGLHAEAALKRASEPPKVMYALCSSYEDGMSGAFSDGPHPEFDPAWVEGDDLIFRLSGDGKVELAVEEMRAHGAAVSKTIVSKMRALNFGGWGVGSAPLLSRSERFVRDRPR